MLTLKSLEYPEKMIDLRDLEAAAYVRVSDDIGAGSEEEGQSGEGQEDEALDVAEEHGMRLPKSRIFNDNNIGASKFSRGKKRDEWDKLLKCIEAGKIKVLIMWECSRGTRRHLEWAQFLDLIEREHILIYAINKGRALDPRDHGDWEILAQEGVKATSEANATSKRVRRGVRKARRKGRPLGVPPYGWRSVYNDRTGRMQTWAPEPVEIKVVDEMYRRVITGESLGSIARDLTRRCDLPEDHVDWVPRTRRGSRWNNKSVLRNLISPTHIGKFWSEPNPETGKREIVEGSWEGAIDEDTWWSAYRILTANQARRGRPQSRPGRVKYLLSNIARCSVCGSTLGVTISVAGVGTLKCRGVNDDNSPKLSPGFREDGTPMPTAGHVGLKAEWFDAYVLEEIARRVCNEDALRELVGEEHVGSAESLAKAAAIYRDIEDMKGLMESRDITPIEFKEYKARWLPEAERLEAEASESEMRPGIGIALELLETAKQSGLVGSELEALVLRAIKNRVPLNGQRELVKALTKSITLFPSSSRSNQFDAERIAARIVIE
jgi:DNA invertase Pin-like site-specific DNA recombinase